jgi:predicted  nucleic acid-binding Zn-ribbon protein
MAHAEGRSCEEVDHEADVADEQCDALRAEVSRLTAALAETERERDALRRKLEAKEQELARLAGDYL